MKGVSMNEIESAVVEMVDKFNGKLLPGDVQAKMQAIGWNPNDISVCIDSLVKREVLLKNSFGCLAFIFPDQDPQKNPYETMFQVGMQLMAQKEEKNHDPVNSPSHYTRGGIEAIDFIEAKGLGFCLGNVVKYVSRAGFKADAKLQDLEKARWYLNREIERLKQGE